MLKIRSHIPNLITLLNLLSGSVAIIFAFSGELTHAGWLIFLAAVFDFLDGFVARLLKAKSEIGAQLDSLADVISFGLAPSIIMYQLLNQSVGLPRISAEDFHFLPFMALLLVTGSAFRLAKFNTDPGQETVFKGLPTPAMGLFVAALPLMLRQNEPTINFDVITGSFYILMTITLFLSWIMVSNIPMMSLKFKSYGWKGNESRFILAAVFVILFFIFRFSAVPVIIILYIILSFFCLSGKAKQNL